MDAIRSFFSKPLYAAIAAFIVGTLFGLVVLGWTLMPLEWKDAPVNLLRADLRADYLRMAIDSYAINRDPMLAKQRWDALGTTGPAALVEVQKISRPDQMPAVQEFTSVVQTALPSPGDAPGGAATETPADTGGGNLTTMLLLMCLLVLVVAAVIAFVVIYTTSRRGPAHMTAAMQAQQAAREAQFTNYESAGQSPPMAQYMASYKIGDDLFDDSFSIDSQSGEFLGECGASISEVIGVGDPKKVTAIEVWLFDKNDIQTVTKVLMSQHAFNDATIKQRLAAKGEPVLVDPGGQTVLETATLRLVARVVDIAYGEGPLPDKSFFETIILEIAVWQK